VHISPYCRHKSLSGWILWNLAHEANHRHHIIKCQIFSQSVQRLQSSGTPKIALSRWLVASPLQQCTHCRATLMTLMDRPLTRFTRSRHFWTVNISETTRDISSHSYYRTSIGSRICALSLWRIRMVTFGITLTDPWPCFQGHGIFEVDCRKNGAYKDKVSLLSYKSYKRKVYLTYWMVLCLVKLTEKSCRPTSRTGCAV